MGCTMLCKILRCWFKGHNSASSVEQLNFLYKHFQCHGRSICLWRSVSLFSGQTVSVNQQQVSTVPSHFNSVSERLFTTGLATKHTLTTASAGVIPPLSRKSRIVRQNAGEIKQVIEENLDKIERFASALDCSLTEMKSLVEMDTRLVTSFSEERVLQTIRHLKQYGFCSSEILSNPPAFCLSIPSLEHRLRQMKEVRCQRLYVLKFGPKKFREMLEFYGREKKVMKGFLSRETYLAVLFGVDEQDVLEAWGKYPHIEHCAVARLTDAYNILRQYGFSQDEIWRDLESLILPPNELKDRLDRMNSAGMLNKADIIPHLRYHGKRQFDIALHGWIEDQKALEGHKDVVDFLCCRLECSRAEIERLFSSYKAFKFLRPRRWKPVLDVLLDEMGIPPQNILSRPVLLGYSAKRLRHRHAVFQENLITEPKAMIADLTLSEKMFAKKYNLVSLPDNDM